LLSDFTIIDDNHFMVLAALSNLGPQKHDSDKEKEAREQAFRANDECGFCLATLYQGREQGGGSAKTSFVNAALKGGNEEDLVKQLP
jgi:hypothetical protein